MKKIYCIPRNPWKWEHRLSLFEYEYFLKVLGVWGLNPNTARFGGGLWGNDSLHPWLIHPPSHILMHYWCVWWGLSEKVYHWDRSWKDILYAPPLPVSVFLHLLALMRLTTLLCHILSAIVLWIITGNIDSAKWPLTETSEIWTKIHLPSFYIICFRFVVTIQHNARWLIGGINRGETLVIKGL